MKKTIQHIEIIIRKEPIRLGQFLKHANHVQDGIEAKIRIQNGEVYVNDQLEKRRGRQLRHGDCVQIDQHIYEIKCAPGQ